MAYELFRSQMAVIGAMRVDSQSTFALDSQFVAGTSGDALMTCVAAPNSQSSGTVTVYAYCTAVTGSPTKIRAAIFPGSVASFYALPDAPGKLAETGDVSCVGAAGSWVAFTLTGVTLTVGERYYICIFNADSSAPASNYPTFVSRGTGNGYATNAEYSWCEGGTTTNGGTSMGTTSRMAATVTKFNDGTIIGSPFVVADTFSSVVGTNTQDRGIRLRLEEDIVIAAAACYRWYFSHIKVFKTDGTEVASATVGNHAYLNTGYGLFSPPVTLKGQTDYDIIWRPGTSTGNGYIASMGTSPPADVLAAAPAVDGTPWRLVYGSTPGSYTVDANRMFQFALFPSLNPRRPEGTSPLNRGMQV